MLNTPVDGRKKLTIGIFFILLFISKIMNLQTSSQSMSTLLSSTSPLTQFNIATPQVKEKFSFVPGWALNNLEKINFQGINTIAYFDVPVAEDGTLYRDTTGYWLFREKYGDLLTQVQSHNAKLVLTVSQARNDVIKQILASPEAQETLIGEITTEIAETGIDGVNVDFEFKGTASKQEKEQFNRFMENLTNDLHESIPNSQVSVSVPDSPFANSLYDVGQLAKKTDKIFILAYNYAVPERKESSLSVPYYGSKANEYWHQVISSVNNFLKNIPPEKIVLETAWYGDGSEYPLYNPNLKEGNKNERLPGIRNTLSPSLSQDTIDRMVVDLDSDAQRSIRRNLPLIAKALYEENILTPNILAYAMATIEHETAGTFEPIEEIQGRKSARRLGYEGGTNFFGRGFIQLTHLRNYKQMGIRIGMGDTLVKSPDLALRADISAQILAAYFKDNNIASLAENGYFVDARAPVNPDYNGWSIANLAWKFLNALG